jgi:hypothetical protein
MDAMSTEEPSLPVPPAVPSLPEVVRAAADPAVKEVSIPLVVDPTLDLRVKPVDSPTSLRARPASRASPLADPEPAVFPRPLAIGLVVLALLVAVIGVRFYSGGEAAVPRPESLNPPAADTAGVTVTDLPPGSDVPAGQGLLSVQVPDGVAIRIDGNESSKLRQAGTLRVALPPGVHLVTVGLGDNARPRIVEIRGGRATNVNLAVP